MIRYLGRYTHRVAISDYRIVSVDKLAKTVTFKWKDYKDNNKQKLMTLSATEFIRRFLLHILPPAFRKIRHYGLLSNRTRKMQLALCRRILNIPQIQSHGNMNASDSTCICKICQATMNRTILSRSEAMSFSGIAAVP